MWMDFKLTQLIPLQHGYLFDDDGCRTCTCRDPCLDITCPSAERCELVQIECIDLPCPMMPICLPVMDSTCLVGEPLKSNGKEISCGPHSEGESCPSTHACQLNPVNHKNGVCCAKQREHDLLFTFPDDPNPTFVKPFRRCVL